MRSGISNIIGKTINAVVVKESEKEPTFQVYLIFSDDTHFELWSPRSEIKYNRRCYPGDPDNVRKYMRGDEQRRIILDAYKEQSGNIVETVTHVENRDPIKEKSASDPNDSPQEKSKNSYEGELEIEVDYGILPVDYQGYVFEDEVKLDVLLNGLPAYDILRLSHGSSSLLRCFLGRSHLNRKTMAHQLL